ncbi:MAG: magnesium transporter CorA family protein [Eubacteriaceae bacterium]|nr:magnesium transporter CorA family protein [Eubacteriaceae bacterium]
MIKIYKNEGKKLVELQEFEDGAWINLSMPNSTELNRVSEYLNVDISNLRAALDEEERSRIEIEDDCILIIVDVPIVTLENDINKYSTLPLGIILTNENIVTVCLQEIPVFKDFILGRVKEFYTVKKTRFILQILFKNASYYLNYLRHIDRMSSTVERELHKSLKNRELIELLELEKSLVYFSTSLRGNEIVLEKMLKLDAIKKYPEDTDLLEDVIIENRQAIEMANIYSNILSGTMDAFASVISNNLNMVMKFLTSVTIVMAIPTIIASLFGMNVPVPLSSNPYAFPLIFMITIGVSALVAIYMMKKKLF